MKGYCRYCGLDDHFETECGPQEEVLDKAGDGIEPSDNETGDVQPRITRADLQTTGEKIPYFGYMRRRK